MHIYHTDLLSLSPKQKSKIMPTNKNASIRYQALDKCFGRTNKKYFIEDLIEACNEALYEFNGMNKNTGERSSVKRRQIFDDIKYMESEAGWQIQLERLKEGKRTYYRYKDPNFSIKLQPLTQREAEQLGAAIQAISRYRNLPSYGWVEEIIATLENRFDIEDKKENVIGFEKNDRLIGIWNLTGILDATSSHQVLKIKYRSFRSNGQDMEYIFHPYFVKQYNNRWFVFGLREDIGKIANLALDRILDFKKAEGIPFQRNKEIDFEHYFDNVVGVTIPANKEPEHIILKASPNRFPYIVSKPIHTSQQTINEEECLLSLDVIPNKELDQQLLSFGPDLEVISPASFREHIGEIIRKSYEKYFLMQKGCTEEL